MIQKKAQIYFHYSRDYSLENLSSKINNISCSLMQTYISFKLDVFK